MIQSHFLRCTAPAAESFMRLLAYTAFQALLSSTIPLLEGVKNGTMQLYYYTCMQVMLLFQSCG